MSQTAKRLNGKKPPQLVCPHVEVCAAGPQQADIMASLGLVLERQEALENRVMAVLDRHHSLAESVTVLKEREAEWLRLLGQVEQAIKGGVRA